MQAASYQIFQSNLSYCNYQKTDQKEIYQLDGDPIEDQPNGFYTKYDDEDEDITYSDKGF